MIAIKNMKLLADLTEQKEVLKEKYENLLIQKQPEFQKVLQTLLNDIKNCVVEKGLQVVEKNDSNSNGFVANYKSVYLRGDLDLYKNELEIYFQGEVINRFKVIPVPSEYYGSYEVPINDDLRNEIENLNREVKSLNEQIVGLESNKYCYIDTVNSNIKFENNAKVIKSILL